jgi:ribosomal protein L31
LKFVDTAGRIEKFKSKFSGKSYGSKKTDSES